MTAALFAVGRLAFRLGITPRPSDVPDHRLMDGGCYHMIPRDHRDAYVHSVSRVAAPGALLIMVGFAR